MLSFKTAWRLPIYSLLTIYNCRPMQILHTIVHWHWHQTPILLVLARIVFAHRSQGLSNICFLRLCHFVSYRQGGAVYNRLVCIVRHVIFKWPDFLKTDSLITAGAAQLILTTVEPLVVVLGQLPYSTVIRALVRLNCTCLPSMHTTLPPKSRLDMHSLSRRNTTVFLKICSFDRWQFLWVFICSRKLLHGCLTIYE